VAVVLWLCFLCASRLLYLGKQYPIKATCLGFAVHSTQSLDTEKARHLSPESHEEPLVVYTSAKDFLCARDRAGEPKGASSSQYAPSFLFMLLMLKCLRVDVSHTNSLGLDFIHGIAFAERMTFIAPTALSFLSSPTYVSPNYAESSVQPINWRGPALNSRQASACARNNRTAGQTPDGCRPVQ